ncbi:F-box domain-containing protein [Mycena chlorophos]|uniref:F-box domain-containing protein n=1 Tax=Mycena chlorophos TaxID=658473 RepID=A0A8H6SQA8_MYCCL|nr:F-box domain-containing protein [Mycena chlorophos]
MQTLHLPQSVTWLRLVGGRWLFVASSDDKVSKLACWDVAFVLEGNARPVAEGYLPGRVKTGAVEAFDSEIVLALGLGPESRSTRMISFRRSQGQYVLVELAALVDSWHVVMFSGDYVGCAIRSETNRSHIVNWRNGEILIIPTNGVDDVPGRRCVPHVMTLWNDFVVIVHNIGLDFYRIAPTKDSNEPITYAGTIPGFNIWEVNALSSESPDSPLRLIALTARGLEMVLLDLFDPAGPEPHTQDGASISRCLLPYPDPPQFSEAPWFKLCVGSGERRALWIGAIKPSEEEYHHPHIASILLPEGTQDAFEPPSSTTLAVDVESGPALSALPLIDLDETLGLLVVGNHFGELAVYDLAQGQLFPGNLPDVDDRLSDGRLLQREPIDLNPPRGPTGTMSEQEFRDSIAHWSQDQLTDNTWTDTWYEGRRFASPYIWLGRPGDIPWLIEHAYGFPGEVFPQAYTVPDYAYVPSILFRVGTRYLVEDSDGYTRSWADNDGWGFSQDTADIQEASRLTAETENEALWKSMHYEWTTRKPRRARWLEQRERGGCFDWLPYVDDSDDVHN